MRPVNSRFSNRIVTNLYYSATKRSLFNQSHAAASKSIIKRLINTNIANQHEDTDESPLLANLYFNRFPNYCQMITDAKSRARRSILIDHCGLENIDLTFNNIEQVYSIEKETKRGFTKLSLIEFKSENDAETVATQVRHNQGLLPVPLKIFQYTGQLAEPQRDLPFPVENVRLSYKRDLSPLFDNYVDLSSKNMMSLAALKLRLVTLVNLERILCAGMFEEYELMPFGSSVIDIGCDSGDLDLVVTRKEDHNQTIMGSLASNSKTSADSVEQSASSKLVHLDKSLYSEIKDNSGVKGTMRWFDHILREYMPLTDGYGVLFVPHAKVPIIKFNARITSIDCDLSFNLGLDHRDRDIMTTNYSGIIMSQILYSLCRNNNLFTSAVIYLRIFGKLTSITSKTPGIGLTNFQLLSLIIFYLQQISLTSRPSSSRGANSSDYRVEFNADLNKNKQRSIVPPFKDLLSAKYPRPDSIISLNDDQLNLLLPKVIMGFFEFYSRFDFNYRSLNLYESRSEKKMDNSSIYVVNPLDRTRNICHNVNRKSLENLVNQVRLATSSLKNSKFECPLSFIKRLMVKQQQQQQQSQRKGSVLNFGGDTQSLLSGRPIKTDDIAQDVCR